MRVTSKRMDELRKSDMAMVLGEVEEQIHLLHMAGVPSYKTEKLRAYRDKLVSLITSEAQSIADDELVVCV